MRNGGGRAGGEEVNIVLYIQIGRFYVGSKFNSRRRDEERDG